MWIKIPPADTSANHANTIRCGAFQIANILPNTNIPIIDIHIIITSTSQIYEHLRKDMADLFFVAEETAPEDYCALPLLEVRSVVALPKYMLPEKLQKKLFLQTIPSPIWQISEKTRERSFPGFL